MTEEKSHGHKEHDEHIEHATYEKKEERYKLEISKVRVWQGVSLILAIAVIFLWFNQGSDSGIEGAVVGQPTQAEPSQPQQQQQPQRLEIDIDDDPVLGDENAPVTIIEFSDFQCSFCKRAFEQAISSLKKDYIDTGKVRLAFRDFPLGFHSEAEPAAEAAECANEQGKFWAYHDALFKNQERLGSDVYVELAEQLKLDVEQFKTCAESGKYKQEVQADFNYGSQVGVSGTPTFFINGIKLVGAQPYSAFKQIIDAELAG